MTPAATANKAQSVQGSQAKRARAGAVFSLSRKERTRSLSVAGAGRLSSETISACRVERSLVMCALTIHSPGRSSVERPPCLRREFERRLLVTDTLLLCGGSRIVPQVATQDIETEFQHLGA